MLIKQLSVKAEKTPFKKAPFKKGRAVLVLGMALSVGLYAMVGMAQSLGLGELWGMSGNFGTHASDAHKKMRANCAQSGVVVAVVDTGIDFRHPDLVGTEWVNLKENRDGKDSDKNGFVDDMHGWDFAARSGVIVDNNGHGTHIAGVIGATGKGPQKFRGVCPGVKMMSLRYYNESASGIENLRNSVAAVEYAIRMGARIINYSGGGTSPSAEEQRVFEEANRRGILVVAAAGNERSNADQKKYYPASYALPNIISVTAIDVKGNVLASSNWGAKTVHVAGPGNAILSTYPQGRFGNLTGTSQATAFVSGMAAMLMSENPQLTAYEVKRIIEESVVPHQALASKTATGGYVNAVRALSKIHEQQRQVSSDAKTDVSQRLRRLLFDNMKD